MTGSIGHGDLRATTVRQVAQLMAAAAITAPKPGQLFLAGKPNFMETVITDDPGTRRQLAAWMRARARNAASASGSATPTATSAAFRPCRYHRRQVMTACLPA